RRYDGRVRRPLARHLGREVMAPVTGARGAARVGPRRPGRAVPVAADDAAPGGGVVVATARERDVGRAARVEVALRGDRGGDGVAGAAGDLAAYAIIERLVEVAAVRARASRGGVGRSVERRRRRAERPMTV